jgi:hypothetical protein
LFWVCLYWCLSPPPVGQLFGECWSWFASLTETICKHSAWPGALSGW